MALYLLCLIFCKYFLLPFSTKSIALYTIAKSDSFVFMAFISNRKSKKKIKSNNFTKSKSNNEKSNFALTILVKINNLSCTIKIIHFDLIFIGHFGCTNMIFGDYKMKINHMFDLIQIKSLH